MEPNDRPLIDLDSGWAILLDEKIVTLYQPPGRYPWIENNWPPQFQYTDIGNVIDALEQARGISERMARELVEKIRE